MFEFIKNKITEFKKEKEREKAWDRIYSKNYDFLKTMPNKKTEIFFHYLVEHSANDMVNIKYSTTKKNVKDLNKFYNEFFSKYESIIIGYNNNVIIDLTYVKKTEANFENVIIIGKDECSDICIKKNGKKNGIYIDELDTQDDIDNEDCLYSSIFYYLIACIFSYKELVIDEIYNEMNNSGK